MLTTYLSGFALSFSLIVAIGAQNAFILKQGLKQQHVFWVCLACALSDSILISFGIAGFGAIIEAYPSIEEFARYAGAAFLIFYGLSSLKTAFTVNHALQASAQSEASLAKTLIMALAFTWLNPHVYLDTVVLLGSISTQYQPNQLQFGIGAVLASWVFFFSLGYGARLLSGFFQRPNAWKVLEIIIGIVMLFLAFSLLFLM